jgi:hypothetical protein
MKYSIKEAILQINIKNRVEKIIFTNYTYIAFFIFAFQLLSCNDKPNTRIITEGEIEYEIEYPDNKQLNPVIAFLPREMKTSFKYNASRTLIEGLFGTFKLTYITNQPQKTNYSLLQIIDKKYVYKAKIDEMAFGYHDMKNVKIIFTDLKKRIAGYKCKHAKAIFENSSIDTVDIYYTNEIGLVNANLNNPYGEIKGVLMEFSVNLVEIKMKFTARKVREKKIDDKLFELPFGYANITEKQMRKLVNDFNQSSEQ